MKYDVCVFGGCSLDRTFFQKVDGSFGEEPDVLSPGGKGSNQAVAASKAGAKTVMITRIGKGEIGDKIISNLAYFGVNVSNVEVDDTINNDYSNIYINLVDKDNEIERFSGAINSFTVDMIDRYKDVLLDSKIIVCQLKIPKEVTEALINFCYENGKTLILTPCRPEKLAISEPGNAELIDKIKIITCNKKEFTTIFNTDDIESILAKYPNKLIVTLGPDGLMYHNGEQVVHMPAIDIDVVDTTGAGDTLAGNLAAFLASGMDLSHALRKAMYAATMKIAVKTAQAGMPFIEDLELFIQNKRNKEFKYSDELNLALRIVKEAYERTRYQDFAIHSKADATLVTDSDLTIEDYLLNKIRVSFPNDNFVTEETYSDNPIKDRTWVIDPIDGTDHFIKKDGFWGIQLAFYDKKAVRFGVIYLPQKEKLLYAAENIGAYLNNERIYLPLEVVPVEQAIVEFGGSLYKEYDTKRMCFRKLMDKDRLKVSNILHINSSCISFSNLALGRTDALIVSTNKPWDVMPGEFICKECGFEITYLDNNSKVKLLTLNDGIKKILMPSPKE